MGKKNRISGPKLTLALTDLYPAGTMKGATVKEVIDHNWRYVKDDHGKPGSGVILDFPAIQYMVMVQMRHNKKVHADNIRRKH